MAGLKLARGLTLDPDYYGGGTFALLAKKGWGKTYAARVIAEELDKARVPFVALDPMDAFWGLRAAKDGSRGGLEVPIFGGPHGDAPLEPTAGAMMADLVVEEGISMVLSLKHFGTRSAEKRFAEDFLDRLYRKNEDLTHLLLDEADLFAPQKPQQGDQKLLGITENIVRRGRNNGIGITMLTQRPAVLNKDVLTQVDGLVVGRMLGPNDRNSIDDWVGTHGDAKQGKAIKDELPELGTGECWVWVPEQGVLKKVTIREARTFDSSPTRKRKGQARREPKKLTDIDLGDIEQKMAATIERAEAEDPKKLNARIRELERDLAKKPEAAEAPEPTEVKVPVLDREVTEDLEVAAEDLMDALEKLPVLAENIKAAATEAQRQLDRAEELVSAPRQDRSGRAAPRPRPRQAARPRARTAPPASPGPVAPSSDAPSGAQQKVLDAIAWWREVGFTRPTKVQVGFIAGYRVGKKIGGTYGNTLGSCRSNGWIDYPSTGEVEITEAGLELATPPNIEQTVTGLQQAVRDRLNPAEARVLDVLIAEYPQPLEKREVGERAGYSVGDRIGGTFGNILGRLRSLALIDYPSTGEAIALPVLFLEGG